MPWWSLASQDRSSASAVTHRIPGDRGGPESPRSVRNDGFELLVQVMRQLENTIDCSCYRMRIFDSEAVLWSV
jgi:hypothetical protein